MHWLWNGAETATVIALNRSWLCASVFLYIFVTLIQLIDFKLTVMIIGINFWQLSVNDWYTNGIKVVESQNGFAHFPAELECWDTPADCMVEPQLETQFVEFKMLSWVMTHALCECIKL